MSDRKMIKWQAFDSVMHSKKVVNEINNKKEDISKPILSEEQLMEIQENILIAYECNLLIEISYFKNGKILIIEEYIQQIDSIKKRIIFKSHSFLSFNQIIKVNFL